MQARRYIIGYRKTFGVGANPRWTDELVTNLIDNFLEQIAQLAEADAKKKFPEGGNGIAKQIRALKN